jgi:hypothetical protein
VEKYSTIFQEIVAFRQFLQPNIRLSAFNTTGIVTAFPEKIKYIAA